VGNVGLSHFVLKRQAFKKIREGSEKDLEKFA